MATNRRGLLAGLMLQEPRWRLARASLDTLFGLHIMSHDLQGRDHRCRGV